MNEKFKATWVSSVINLDWPSKSTLSITNAEERISAQKNELRIILDEIKRMQMNTLIFQVKPCADAIYQSEILPWSKYLTGVLGKNPGFDPLSYVIEQAHSRGIKLHAWLNPYRISMNTLESTIKELNHSSPDSSISVFKMHPNWVGTACNRFVLDPGIPEVREWIKNIIEEIVNKYKIDGIHFDDYFYYESSDSKLNDDATYRKYGQDLSSKADWRRNNTYSLIQECREKIKIINPQIEFGISPAGVWRNKSDDPLGSDTQAGNPNYDYAYADTRKWVLEEIIDYIVPQVYWPFARQVARYDTITKWWSETVKQTQTKLYIGMALYKVGIPSDIEPDWSIDGGVPEISRQLNLNYSLPEVKGCVFFRHLFLREPQTQQAVEYIKNSFAARELKRRDCITPEESNFSQRVLQSQSGIVAKRNKE